MSRPIILLLLFTFAVGDGFSSDRKISRDLENLDSNASVDVIVQYKHAPTDAHHRAAAARGALLKTKLEVLKSAAYRIPVSALENLASDPEVAYISPDRLLHATLDYYEPTTNANIARQYGWTGQGIGIAVIDSGISTAEQDLGIPGVKAPTRVVYSQSFLTTDTSTADAFGHGTHVAGILAGNGAVSTGSIDTYTFFGMAPSANLINLRVLDGNGQGTDSAVISAIQTAINLKSQFNIRVMNLSLGRPVFEGYALDPLCQAVEAAWKAGIVVVVAAGNSGRYSNTSGYATITAPGNDPYVITVGAMKTMETPSRGDDLIASYSSKGPTLLDHVVKPDLVAPGNRVVSLMADKTYLPLNYSANKIQILMYQNTTTSGLSKDYYRLSGTSMAAPMVSGTAALMIQKDATLTPDTVKARLMKTSTKSFPASSIAVDPSTGQTYTSQYGIFTIGAG